MTDFSASSLIERLPIVRGKLTLNAPLAAQTWFRVGGPAEVLYRPEDEEDLSLFLAGCPADIPVTVIGAASNLLIRDGGVPGIVIRLGPNFGKIQILGTQLRVGGGALDLNVARAALDAGLTGLEFLCGIPGTIGGGLRMNAGAYGRAFKDSVLSAEITDRDGTRGTLTPAQIGFAYRQTNLSKTAIVTSVLLQAGEGESEEIRGRMREIQKSREDSQPIRDRTGGSTFANPEHDIQKRRSWQLIDAAGCRGLKIGQAKVSEKHCNFLINTGNATAAEIETLGEEVRRRVRDHSGVDLRWEIKRIGIPIE